MANKRISKGFALNKIKIACVVAVSALALGLVGCSSDGMEDFVTVDGNVKSGDETSSATPQTITEACTVIVEPLSESVAVFFGSGDMPSDPKETVDVWNDFAVSFSDATSGIFNEDVKQASKEVHADLLTVAEESKKVFVENKTDHQASYDDALRKLETSINDLGTLCS